MGKTFVEASPYDKIKIKGIKIGQIVLKKDKMTYYLKLSLSSCSSFFNGKDLYNIL